MAQTVKFTINPSDATVKVEGGWLVVETAPRFRLATIEIDGKKYNLTLKGDEPLIEGERIYRTAK